jgi:hypothetical protein
MLRVNTSFVLKLPPFETTVADARLLECRNQLYIGSCWSLKSIIIVGLGDTCEVGKCPARELNSYDVDAFQVNYMFSLLRLKPVRVWVLTDSILPLQYLCFRDSKLLECYLPVLLVSTIVA